MESARRVKHLAIAREIQLVAVLARCFPAFIAPPAKPQPTFPAIVCIETPKGQLIWRLSLDDKPLFDHLPERPNSAITALAGEKHATLEQLAKDGW